MQPHAVHAMLNLLPGLHRSVRSLTSLQIQRQAQLRTRIRLLTAAPLPFLHRTLALLTFSPVSHPPAIAPNSCLNSFTNSYIAQGADRHSFCPTLPSLTRPQFLQLSPVYTIA
jgi:hypothetical protein